MDEPEKEKIGTLNNSSPTTINISPPILSQQPYNNGSNYLFAPPHYQPRFHTTDINAKFPQQDKPINSFSPDSLSLFLEEDNEKLNNSSSPTSSCCWDYNDYTNIRITFTLRTMAVVAAILIAGFYYFSLKYHAFYLVICIVLMSTGITFGQSLQSFISVYIGLFLSLAFCLVVIYTFPLTSLTVGLAIPIGLVIVLILLGFSPNPMTFKIFSIFFPVFLLMAMLVQMDGSTLLKFFEMCGISFAFSIMSMLLPWPHQSNHYIDSLIKRLLKNSAKLQYLITRGFLNERYNRTHLLDYSADGDYFAKHKNFQQDQTIDSTKTRKIRQKIVKHKTNTLAGSLFESHFDPITKHNKKHQLRKQRRLEQQQYIDATQQTPQSTENQLFTSTSPQNDSLYTLGDSNEWKKLPFRHFSHQLAYDLHCQGGRNLYQESYSDDNTSSTDDETCLFIYSSQSSSTNSDVDNNHNVIENNDKMAQQNKNKALYRNNSKKSSTSSKDKLAPLIIDNEIHLGELHNGLHHSDTLQDEQNADISEENAYFKDLFNTFDRQPAPNHPQGSLKTNVIGRYTTTTPFNTSSSDSDIDDEQDLLPNPLPSSRYTSPQSTPRAKNKENSLSQKLPGFNHEQRENEHFLHVPFPQLYFTNLGDILIEMESDLDLLRTHIGPLRIEGIFFRFIFVIFSFFTCCMCGKYSYSDLRTPKSSSAFNLQHPTSAKPTPNSPFNAATPISLSKDNFFYPHPSQLHPNIFNATTYFSIPYNPESLSSFVMEFLLAITNVRGMMHSLKEFPNFSRGGLMLYHFVTTLMRHDMKRSSLLYKAYIVNILNHNKDIAAFDSAFIHAVFNISSQNYFTTTKSASPIQTTQNSIPTSPTSNTTSFQTSSAQPSSSTAQYPKKTNRISPGLVHHRDLFSALYISLTKHKQMDKSEQPLAPTEKDLRKMSFVPGTYSCLLHSLRNLWLHYSRVRQFAFYGIRKTRTVLTTTTLKKSNGSTQTKHKSTVYTRKIADPIFDFYTSISQRHSLQGAPKSPTQDQSGGKYETITSSVLNSAFTYLFSTPQQQEQFRQPGTNMCDFNSKVNKNGSNQINAQSPTNPPLSSLASYPIDSIDEHSTSYITPTQSKQAGGSTLAHHQRASISAKKSHFTVTLDDITVFNNFFFNYDRFYTRLLHTILPAVTSHLYPITSISTTIPTALSIPDSYCQLGDFIQQENVINGSAATSPNTSPLTTPQQSPRNSPPQTTADNSTTSINNHDYIANQHPQSLPPSNLFSILSTTSPIPSPSFKNEVSNIIQSTTLESDSDESSSNDNSHDHKNRQDNRIDKTGFLRAVILIPGSIPSHYSFPAPCTVTDLTDFFVPLLVLKLWNIFTTILSPMKITKPQTRESSVVHMEFECEQINLSGEDLININQTTHTNDLTSPNTAQQQFKLSSMDHSESFSSTKDVSVDVHSSSLQQTHVLGQNFIYTRNNQTGQLEMTNLEANAALHRQNLHSNDADADADEVNIDNTTDFDSMGDYEHRYKAYQPPLYIDYTFKERLLLTWRTLIKPSPADKQFYRFFWRALICITASALPAVIPSSIQIHKFNHWPTLSAAILLGSNSGASIQLVFNRVIANVLGAFYSYFMILIALQIDKLNDNDGNLYTGIGSAAFLVVAITLYAGYFSYLRSSRNKNNDYTVTTIVSVCVVGLGSVDVASAAETSSFVLSRLEYTIIGAIFVLVSSFLIYPNRGDWAVYRLLSATIRNILTLMDFNAQYLAHSSLYQYFHETFDSNFGPTLFPLVSLDDHKKSTIQYSISEKDYKEFKQLQQRAETSPLQSSSTYNLLFEKIILLEHREHAIFHRTNTLMKSSSNSSNSPYSTNRSNNPQNTKMYNTTIRMFHPCDSRSRFYHMALSIFTNGKMDPAMIGLTQIPYPTKAALLEKCHNNSILARRQLNTIRHTNYLQFLHIYNAQMKQRSSDIRTNVLLLSRNIVALENETVIAMVSPIKTQHIAILRSTVQHLYIIVRLVHRIHEIIFAYTYMLVSLNEYYNISGTDMTESFKSVIQLHYHQNVEYLQKQHVQKKNEKTEYASTNSIPSQLNDQNEDITQLLMTHSYHLLNNTVTPKEITTDEQLIHLKIKSHQVANMLINESMPLFLNFNQTVSLLFQSILGTIDTLINRTTIHTFLSVAITCQFSYPLYHSHNTHTFHLFRTQQLRKNQYLSALSQQETSASTNIINDVENPTSIQNASALARVTLDQQYDPLKSFPNQLINGAQDGGNVENLAHSLALCEEEDEIEFFNTPYAHGVLFSFLGLYIGPCCIRRTPQERAIKTSRPLSNAAVLNHRLKSTSKAGPDPLSTGIELSSLQRNQSVSLPLKAILPKPQTRLQQNTPKTHYKNPYYESSQRMGDQKQYLYQLISYVRQIRTISKEITYQRFYGGRDGYFSTYPAPLILIEHAFLTAITLLPHSFVDIVASLHRLEDEVV